MYILVIAVFIILALADFPKLIKSRKWKAVVVLALFYSTVLTLAILMALGMTLPSPFEGIQKFITNVLKLGYPKP